MLTLENVQATVGDFVLSADLRVERGEVVAVIGPSGGGKSTLLGLIAGFLVPDRGRVLCDGADMVKKMPGARPVSVIFQDNNLFGHLSAFDNVALGLRPSGRLSEAERDQVTAALGRVGLDGLAERKPGALSGGQQSRVALARVLVQARPLLLLDEAFAALGPGLRDEMLDLVVELARVVGATVLMVTHDPRDAARVAGRTIYVEAGQVQPPVDTAALLAEPPDGLRDYLGRRENDTAAP